MAHKMITRTRFETGHLRKRMPFEHRINFLLNKFTLLLIELLSPLDGSLGTHWPQRAAQGGGGGNLVRVWPFFIGE